MNGPISNGNPDFNPATTTTSESSTDTDSILKMNDCRSFLTKSSASALCGGKKGKSSHPTPALDPSPAPIPEISEPESK